MSSLREQFEAWYAKEFLKGDESGYMFMRRHDCVDAYIHIRIQEQWISFQAGHAVNADLLGALQHIEQAFCDSPAHGALACEMASIATEAIKKARAE